MKKSLPEQSQELQQKISQQNTLLNNLRVESRVALQSRQQQIKDIEAETDSLLVTRASKLKVIEEDTKKVLEPLLEKILALKESIKVLELDKIKLETILTGCSQQSEDLRRAISELKDQQQDERDAIDSLKGEKSGIIESIDSLKESILPLQEELRELRSELNDLSSSKERLLREIASTQAISDTEKVDKERQIANLNGMIHDLSEKSRYLESEQTAVREDLANRIRQADERDLNLKRREFKVEQGEQTIQRNASLLNL